jgi:hypothetical protein
MADGDTVAAVAGGADASIEPDVTKAISSTWDASTLPRVCKVKGLPYRATVQDIVTFFDGLMRGTEHIWLRRLPSGRPNGEVLAGM